MNLFQINLEQPSQSYGFAHEIKSEIIFGSISNKKLYICESSLRVRKDKSLVSNTGTTEFNIINKKHDYSDVIAVFLGIFEWARPRRRQAG